MTDPQRPLGAVWPTGTRNLAEQLRDRGYVDRSRTDPRLMPPAIAEHAILALTRPGDIVLDPDCGAGSTIIEALRVGRHAIGLTGRSRWWRIARANVTAAKAGGAGPDGMVLVLNRRTTTLTAAATGLTRRVALLLATLRPATTTSRMSDLLTESRPLLRPGGHVVITTPPVRDAITRELTDRLREILIAGTAAGFAPIARCVALTTDPATTSTPQQGTGRQRLAAHVGMVSAFHTVVVFRADPDAEHAAITLPVPPPPIRRRSRIVGIPSELVA